MLCPLKLFWSSCPKLFFLFPAIKAYQAILKSPFFSLPFLSCLLPLALTFFFLYFLAQDLMVRFRSPSTLRVNRRVDFCARKFLRKFISSSPFCGLPQNASLPSTNFSLLNAHHKNQCWALRGVLNFLRNPALDILRCQGGHFCFLDKRLPALISCEISAGFCFVVCLKAKPPLWVKCLGF